MQTYIHKQNARWCTGWNVWLDRCSREHLAVVSVVAVWWYDRCSRDGYSRACVYIFKDPRCLGWLAVTSGQACSLHVHKLHPLHLPADSMWHGRAIGVGSGPWCLVRTCGWVVTRLDTQGETVSIMFRHSSNKSLPKICNELVCYICRCLLF